MDTLQSILSRVLHRRGLQSVARASTVAFKAQEWLTRALPQFAASLRVEKLSSAVLSISCTHNVEAQECVPLLSALKEYLKRECRESRIDDIRIVRRR